jgi:hypothetical protein
LIDCFAVVVVVVVVVVVAVVDDVVVVKAGHRDSFWMCLLLAVCDGHSREKRLIKFEESRIQKCKFVAYCFFLYQQFNSFLS